VTVNLVGVVAPGLPRTLVLELDEGATLRALVEEVGRRGGAALCRSLWDEDGRLARAVAISVDGEIVDPERLDVELPRAGEAAEVFLIRPIFGGV
jgi:sulfur carrier protein ThiS